MEGFMPAAFSLWSMAWCDMNQWVKLFLVCNDYKVGAFFSIVQEVKI
jgi:hypothetical protein